MFRYAQVVTVIQPTPAKCSRPFFVFVHPIQTAESCLETYDAIRSSHRQPSFSEDSYPGTKIDLISNATRGLQVAGSCEIALFRTAFGPTSCGACENFIASLATEYKP
jgi:hypothetical protein